VQLGPDSARYLLAGQGERVARPFHLRWLLPKVCGDNPSRWRALWLTSWGLAAVAMWSWSYARTDDWRIAGAATVLLLALPGVLGPPVVRPVGVDLPAMALSLAAVALLERGPALALAAAQVIPTQWLLLACVVHVVWWRKPELI